MTADPCGEALEVAMRKAAAEPTLSWGHTYDRDKPLRLRRYRWWVDQTVDGVTTTVAEGRAFTERGATNTWYRAYLKALNRPVQAVETSPPLNRYRMWVR